MAKRKLARYKHFPELLAEIEQFPAGHRFLFRRFDEMYGSSRFPASFRSWIIHCWNWLQGGRIGKLHRPYPNAPWRGYKGHLKACDEILQQSRYADHRMYLGSRAWRFRRLYKKLNSHFRCEAHGCFTELGLHCHHLTYLRMGSERLNDLMWLCPGHHNQVHSDVGIALVKATSRATGIPEDELQYRLDTEPPIQFRGVSERKLRRLIKEGIFSLGGDAAG